MSIYSLSFHQTSRSENAGPSDMTTGFDLCTLIDWLSEYSPSSYCMLEFSFFRDDASKKRKREVGKREKLGNFEN